MPSKLFLIGDTEAIWLNDPADLVLQAVEKGLEGEVGFIRLDMIPLGEGHQSYPAYFRVSRVSAILPVQPDEHRHMLDNPPDWVSD